MKEKYQNTRVRSQDPGRILSPVFCFLLLFSIIHCGKKGPLKLISATLPEPVENLQISQIGKTIKLNWNFPTFLSDKKTKFDISKVKIIYLHYSENEIPFKKFIKKSMLLLKLKPSQLLKEDNSNFVKIKFKSKNLNNTIHYFSIRYKYIKKKSPICNIKTIRTELPPKPINDLNLTKENKIIKLKWSRPTFNILNKPIKNIAGYTIYKKITNGKKSDNLGNFKKLNKETILNEYYEDSETSIDGDYSYYVSTVISNRIESDPSAAVMVHMTDTFPPDIPSNLVCFKAKDHIFLMWEKVKDSDLSHYRIYRKNVDEKEFKLIADKITKNDFKDKNVVNNKKYYYYVTSVDEKKNESERSNIIKEIF